MNIYNAHSPPRAPLEIEEGAGFSEGLQYDISEQALFFQSFDNTDKII